MTARPTIVAISGFSSNVGKTTLVCELLRALAGWEAIKLTRGHYRSCGRDPAGCCVSDLLRDEAVIRSGRKSNYQIGKDTGRFWDAGASNVHWVIAKDDQVEDGISEALARVKSVGVIIEGNSFLDYLEPDLAVMCARSDGAKVKPSARRALLKSDLLYLSSLENDAALAREQFEDWQSSLTIELSFEGLPVITREDLPRLIAGISRREQSVGSSFSSLLYWRKQKASPEIIPHEPLADSALASVLMTKDLSSAILPSRKR
jgi:molybdopterin-guanine dinucleotide biosynthesis protein